MVVILLKVYVAIVNHDRPIVELMENKESAFFAWSGTLRSGRPTSPHMIAATHNFLEAAKKVINGLFHNLVSFQQ